MEKAIMSTMKTARRTTMQGFAIAALAVASTLVPAAGARAATGGAEVLTLYAKVHASLAGDSVAEVRKTAAALADAAAKSGETGYAAVAEAARALAGDDLATLREQFHGVSKAMAKLVESGALAGADIYYCSMADGYWLQAKGDAAVRNPYYGKSMLGCGWTVDKVEG
jgi:hypothetical protein